LVNPCRIQDHQQRRPVLKLVAAGSPDDRRWRVADARPAFHAPADAAASAAPCFAYFRWWRWLEPKDSRRKQLRRAGAAGALRQNPAGFKPEALAARAVPDWLRTRWYPKDGSSSAARASAWIRAKAGTGIALTKN